MNRRNIFVNRHRLEAAARRAASVSSSESSSSSDSSSEYSLGLSSTSSDSDSSSENVPQPRVARRVAQRQRRVEPQGAYRNANNTLARAVSWVFTLWLNEEDEDAVNNADYRPPDPNQFQLPVGARLTFIRYQLERGANGLLGRNGLHIQGYLEFDQRVTAINILDIMQWTEAHGWDMNNIYLAPRNGPRQAALDYVWKDVSAVEGTRHEAGQLRPEEVRTQGAAVAEGVNQGMYLEDFMERMPDLALRFANQIKTLVSLREKNEFPEARKVICTCLWGDTGTGKTYHVFKTEGPRNVYSKISGKFYDGYRPNIHNVLLFDECLGEVPVNDFLKALDEHPHTVEVKGGVLCAKWTKVYVTSNVPPSKWFPNANDRSKAALKRRFDEGGIIKYVDKDKLDEHFEELEKYAGTPYAAEHENTVIVDRDEIERARRLR